jgi:hypothetical protein
MRSAIRPTRWRRLLAAVAISFIEFFLVEREGRAEPATYSSRLGGAAAAGRTMVRSTAAPSRIWLRANADDDVAAAAAGRAVQLRGHQKQAALKDQRYRGAR